VCGSHGHGCGLFGLARGHSHDHGVS
jgi:hypothetical protein